MSDKLRVLFIPTNNSGTIYWRMFNFNEAAYRNGVMDVHTLWWQKDIEKTTHPWESDIIGTEFQYRIRNEMRDWAKQADVIVCQMVHNQFSLNEILDLRDANPDKPILAEIDDDMINVPTYNEAFNVYRPGEDASIIAQRMFTKVDGVICSTPYLAELYSDWNSFTRVVPNCIDFERWGNLKNNNKPGIRIGWAGGGTHKDDIAPLVPAIKSILAKHKTVKFVFLGGAPKCLDGIECVENIRKWSRIDKYPKTLALMDFDIGIFPIQDNAFNRGKSNLRWLEYSALGIPTVAFVPTENPGYTHIEQTMRSGDDGLMTHTPEQFEKALDSLIENRTYRIAMGARAKDRIRQDFNVDKIVCDYRDILLEAISLKRNENESCDSAGACEQLCRGPESNAIHTGAV